jgi:hypothetical protein
MMVTRGRLLLRIVLVLVMMVLDRENSQAAAGLKMVQMQSWA